MEIMFNEAVEYVEIGSKLSNYQDIGLSSRALIEDKCNYILSSNHNEPDKEIWDLAIFSARYLLDFFIEADKGAN